MISMDCSLSGLQCQDIQCRHDFEYKHLVRLNSVEAAITVHERE